MYNTVEDAKVTFDNSGCLEWVAYGDLEKVYEYMYRNDKTPEEAAKAFTDTE